MSDERPARKVVDLSFWRETHLPKDEPDDDEGGGGGLPPIGPPGGDGSTPVPAPFGEDHFSEELSKELGEDWRCAWPKGVWYRWDGQRWDSRQGDFIVRQKAQLVSRRLVGGIATAALARTIQRRTTAGGAVWWTSSNERHAVWDEELNRENPWEINTPAGLLMLKTGDIEPPARERLLTRLTGAVPAPEAECPRWLQFLDEATGKNKPLQNYLQRMCGYFLTASISEHLIFFLYGKSRTGKSVFVSVLRALLGDYAIAATVEMFIETEGQRHSTEVMDLKGPRLVIASETPAGKRWNDALLKQISGGDSIRANRMRTDPEEFLPVCKLLLVGNHRPKIRDGDDGLTARFLVIPFSHRQPVLDKDLVDKLKLELPGIFKWAIEGEIKRLQSGGSLDRANAPQVIKEATDEYFDAEDLIKQWVEQCCVLDAKYSTSTEDLYRSFRRWMERHGERFPPASRLFSTKLVTSGEELGITRVRTHRFRGFVGIALAEGQEDML
jgi:putative DNA primase/helicase